MRNSIEQFTIRIYDSKELEKINEAFSKSRNNFSCKQSFLRECLLRGLDIVMKEQGFMKRIGNIEELYDEIHKTFINLQRLIAMSEKNAKENIANLTVNRKILSCNYNMLLGISEDSPKDKDFVESGMFDDVPPRFMRLLDDILKVYLSKNE